MSYTWCSQCHGYKTMHSYLHNMKHYAVTVLYVENVPVPPHTILLDNSPCTFLPPNFRHCGQFLPSNYTYVSQRFHSYTLAPVMQIAVV